MDEAATQQPDIETCIYDLLDIYERTHIPAPFATFEERSYAMLREYNIVRPHTLQHMLEIMNEFDPLVDVTIFD